MELLAGLRLRPYGSCRRPALADVVPAYMVVRSPANSRSQPPKRFQRGTTWGATSLPHRRSRNHGVEFPPSSMALAAGTRLGPYEILSPLGAGGMGEVYRARDSRLGREVAIKVLPQNLSASPESRQRFEREAKTISQLSHPHICTLYDVGREGETEFLVMELLEGEPLSERLAKGALPLEQTLRFGTRSRTRWTRRTGWGSCTGT